MKEMVDAKLNDKLGGLVIVIGVAAMGVFWPAPMQAQEAVDGEFDRLVDIVDDDRAPHIQRLAAAHGLGDMRSYLVVEDYLERLEEVADELDDPLVEFVVRRKAARADLEWSQSDIHENTAFADDYSCVVDWNVVGPFSNSSMQAFERQLAPELGEEGPFEGRYDSIDWRPLPAGHHLCSFQLGRWVKPSTSAVAYLATEIEVDEATEAMVLTGAQSAYQVWVNGESVGQRTTEDGLGIDAEGWEVALEAGPNEVLVKLGSSGDGGMSWVFRLVDEQGQPLEDWSAQRPSQVDAVESFQDVGTPHGGARVAIEDGVDADREPTTRLMAARLWSQLYSEDGSEPWRDVGESLADDYDELSPRQLLWLAELYDEHWQREVILDVALDGDGGDDRLVRWRRAVERGETLSELEAEKKRRELEALADESPRFLLALESLVGWYRDQGDTERALQVIERFDGAQRTLRPAWVQKAAQLHENAGLARRASELRREAVEVHQLSGAFGWTTMREALAKGDDETARRLVDGYRQRAPWSRRWGIHESRLHRSAEAYDEALAVIDAMIDETPGDASLRQRRAELLLAAGDRPGAMEAVEEAISLRPQATRYQDFLEHLQPESSRFYEPWLVHDVRQVAEEAGEGSRAYDIIVDQQIHQVASNGLASEFEQRVHRVRRDEGIDSARQRRISYVPSDERVEVLGVRVHRADGTIAEDYSEWTRSRTRQGARKYNDRAYLYLRANDVDVGDLVEFRYVTHQVANENFRGDYFGDTRYIQRTRPVALSRYAVHYPEDWELYFRPPEHEHRRLDNQLPDGTSVQGQQVTGFEMRQLPRVHTEDDQPGNTDVYDYILASSKQTYDEVATWWWELIEEQLVVDDAIAAQVDTLIEGLDDDADKLEAIYEYVVRNTRYLHLGLGIHGWKPYRTSTVFRNRYGDCKDKAALLKVMLEEAGIDAEMVLVRTRRLGTVDDFPANMHVFNHAVTYVPSKDLFMDPTAQFNGPYELTQMDQGAQALIVEDGGHGSWLKMPVDDAEDNRVREYLEVDLRPEVPVMSGRVEAHGDRAVRNRRRLEDRERRDEIFEDRLRRRFAGLELVEADYHDLDELTMPTEIRFQAEVPDALRGNPESGSLYPYVAPMELLDEYARESTRHQDLTFRVPFVREAEIRYRLPDEVAVERLPEATELNHDFGHFDISFEIDGRELVVDTSYAIETQRVDRDEYSEFRSFVAEMDAALDETIRLVGQEVEP